MKHEAERVCVKKKKKIMKIRKAISPRDLLLSNGSPFTKLL
jgi:hypothetical protein